jgi:hypothetical protein
MNTVPYESKKSWEDVFSSTKSGKMSFFFFNYDTISKDGWEMVRTDYKTLKRKDVTYDDAQNSQWALNIHENININVP